MDEFAQQKPQQQSYFSPEVQAEFAPKPEKRNFIDTAKGVGQAINLFSRSTISDIADLTENAVTVGSSIVGSTAGALGGLATMSAPKRDESGAYIEGTGRGIDYVAASIEAGTNALTLTKPILQDAPRLGAVRNMEVAGEAMEKVGNTLLPVREGFEKYAAELGVPTAVAAAVWATMAAGAEVVAPTKLIPARFLSRAQKLSKMFPKQVGAIKGDVPDVPALEQELPPVKIDVAQKALESDNALAGEKIGSFSTSADGKMVGYRIDRIDNAPKVGDDVPMSGDGRQHGGGYVAADEQYVRDYYQVGDEGTEALVRIEFDESDVKHGNITDRQPEIVVGNNAKVTEVTPLGADVADNALLGDNIEIPDWMGRHDKNLPKAYGGRNLADIDAEIEQTLAASDGSGNLDDHLRRLRSDREKLVHAQSGLPKSKVPVDAKYVADNALADQEFAVKALAPDERAGAEAAVRVGRGDNTLQFKRPAKFTVDPNKSWLRTGVIEGREFNLREEVVGNKRTFAVSETNKDGVDEFIGRIDKPTEKAIRGAFDEMTQSQKAQHSPGPLSDNKQRGSVRTMDDDTRGVNALKTAGERGAAHGIGERGNRTFAGAEVYHSTDDIGAKAISEDGYSVVGDGYYGEAVSFTDSLEYSQNFGDTLTTAIIKDDAKILDMANDADFQVWADAQKRGVPLASHKRHPGDKTWAEIIMEKGYDGLYDDGAGDLFIYNVNAIERKPNALDNILAIDPDNKQRGSVRTIDDDTRGVNALETAGGRSVTNIDPAKDAFGSASNSATDIALEGNILERFFDAFEQGIPGIKPGERATIDQIRASLESKSFKGDIPDVMINGQKMSIRNPNDAVRMYEFAIKRKAELDKRYTNEINNLIDAKNRTDRVGDKP